MDRRNSSVKFASFVEREKNIVKRRLHVLDGFIITTNTLPLIDFDSSVGRNVFRSREPVGYKID